jgi:hypothetical protein
MSKLFWAPAFILFALAVIGWDRIADAANWVIDKVLGDPYIPDS